MPLFARCFGRVSEPEHEPAPILSISAPATWTSSSKATDAETAAIGTSKPKARKTMAAAAAMASSVSSSSSTQANLCSLWSAPDNAQKASVRKWFIARNRGDHFKFTGCCGSVRLVCCYSLSSVPSASLPAHQRRCLGHDLQACSTCEEPIGCADLVVHESRCLEKLISSEAFNDAAMRAERQGMSGNGLLTQRPLQGLQYAQEQASKLSKAAEAAVLARVQKLGFTRSDLIKTLAFVRDRAPIVVHLNLSGSTRVPIPSALYHPVLDDSHYRSVHELPDARGMTAPRIVAEQRMFGPAHNASMQAAERVKYGALNFTADPMGVRSATGYGDSFLLLRNETVRARITIMPNDSLGSSIAPAVCESFCHVLAAFSDQELASLLRVAIGETRHVETDPSAIYKEVQIHGLLDLRRDVSCLFVNRRHKDDAAMMQRIEAFRVRNQCEVVVMEAPRPRPRT